MGDVKDKLKQLFRQWDRNHDGFVARDELENALSGIGLSVSLEEQNLMFNAADKDGNGVIDTDEFIDWAFSGDQRIEKAIFENLPHNDNLVTTGLCGMWRRQHWDIPGSTSAFRGSENYTFFPSGTALCELEYTSSANDRIYITKARGWGMWRLEANSIIVECLLTQTEAEKAEDVSMSHNTYTRPHVLELDRASFETAFVCSSA